MDNLNQKRVIICFFQIKQEQNIISLYKKIGNLPNVDPYDESPDNLLFYGSQGQYTYNQIMDYLQSHSQQVLISKLPFIKTPDGIKSQIGGTCYAHVTVKCIRCVEARLKRICPQNAYQIYLDKIVKKFGCGGAQLSDVLKLILPELNLKYKQVRLQKQQYQENAKEKTEYIKKYLKKGIPILITVYRTDQLLTSQKTKVNLKINAHAMVIVGIEYNYWKVRNSWGKQAHCGGIVKLHQESYNVKAYIIYGPKQSI